MLEVVLEEKRREIIKEWIDSGRIGDINTNYKILPGIRKMLLKIKWVFLYENKMSTMLKSASRNL